MVKKKCPAKGLKKKVKEHLKEDIKDSKKGIADDKKLIKKVKNAKSIGYNKEEHEDYKY